MPASSELPGDATLSGELVNKALGQLPKDLGAGVVRRVIGLAAEAYKTEGLKRTQLSIAQLAIIAHLRYQPELPNDLDKPSLDQFTSEWALNVLHHYGTLPTNARAAIPASAIDFAACFYTRHEVLTGTNPGNLVNVLESAGKTLPKMYDRLCELLLRSGNSAYGSIEQLHNNLPDIYAVSHHMPDDVVMSSLAATMRGHLREVGYTLHELGPDHTYGFNQDGTYHLPMVDERNLPAALV